MALKMENRTPVVDAIKHLLWSMNKITSASVFRMNKITLIGLPIVKCKSDDEVCL